MAFTFSGMAHPPSTRDFNRMRGNMYEWSLRWNEIRKAYNYSRSFKKIEGICVELFCSKKNMEVRPYPTLPYPTLPQPQKAAKRQDGPGERCSHPTTVRLC